MGGNLVGLDRVLENGSIFQMLSILTVGSETVVSFFYADDQQYGYAGLITEAFNVSLGGQTLSTHVLTDPGHGFTGWRQASLHFTPPSNSETLSFLAQGIPNGEPLFTLLDGVSVADNTAVTPEPSSIVLFGTGLLTVGGLLRRLFLLVTQQQNLNDSSPPRTPGRNETDPGKSSSLGQRLTNPQQEFSEPRRIAPDLAKTQTRRNHPAHPGSSQDRSSQPPAPAGMCA